MAGLIAYVERRIRAAISEIPDGVYVGEDAVDDDGIGDTPLPVRATVTVAGDALTVDFTGTSPQVRTHLNAPFASTVSATPACLKAVLTGDGDRASPGRRRATADNPQQCVSTDWQHETASQASRRAPAEGDPEMMDDPLEPRRAPCGTRGDGLANGSAKILRGQPALPHRNRRTWTRRCKARPWEGTSIKRRS